MCVCVSVCVLVCAECVCVSMVLGVSARLRLCVSQFISVTMTKLVGAESTYGDIMDVFQELDDDSSGLVSVQTLRHLLSGIPIHEALSKEEVTSLPV